MAKKKRPVDVFFVQNEGGTQTRHAPTFDIDKHTQWCIDNQYQITPIYHAWTSWGNTYGYYYRLWAVHPRKQPPFLTPCGVLFHNLIDIKGDTFLHHVVVYRGL